MTTKEIKDLLGCGDQIIHSGELDGQQVLTTWLPTLSRAKAQKDQWDAKGAVWSKVITHQRVSCLGGKYRVVAHFPKTIIMSAK